jgi:C4-type Zn-finger protein
MKNKQNKNYNYRKCSYLLFCEKCGHPRMISKFILFQYFIKLNIDNVLCDNCGYKNIIPNYIKKILPELTDSI